MIRTSIESQLLSESGAINAVSMRVEGKTLAFSMRRNGTNVGPESENRKEFFGSIGFDETAVVRGEQVHGDKIALADAPKLYPGTDALVTDKGGLLLGVSIADCVPVLIFDRRLKIAAAVHAGWRGTEKQIVAKTLEFIENNFGSKSEDVVAFVGPAAGPCCYEVGEEVAEKFPPETRIVTKKPGKEKLNLKLANVMQLVAKGVPSNNIETSNRCTICDRDFHSYRRDGNSSGRMLAVIAIK